MSATHFIANKIHPLVTGSDNYIQVFVQWHHQVLSLGNDAHKDLEVTISNNVLN